MVSTDTASVPSAGSLSPLSGVSGVSGGVSDHSQPQEEEHSYNEEEDDPLGVKRLALSFDYLLYKIQDRVTQLAEQTHLSVERTVGDAEEQLVLVEESITRLRALTRTCDEIETEFLGVEQIGVIVREFTNRLDALERFYRRA